MRKRQKVEKIVKIVEKKEAVVDNGVAYECTQRRKMEKPQFSEAQVQEMLQTQRKQILDGSVWRHVLMKVGPPLEDSEKTDHAEKDDGEDKAQKYRKHLVKLVNCATGDASIVVISEALLKQNNPRVLRAFLQTKKIHLAQDACVYLEKEKIVEEKEE